MVPDGLSRADGTEKESLIDGNVYQPPGNTEPDYIAAIAQYVAAGNSLCVTVGFLMGSATMDAAAKNPSINFAIVDMVWDDPAYPANLRGIHFSVDQAA